MVEIYGRKITRAAAEGHAAAPLPAGPAPRRLQPARPWPQSPEVILCESLIDALTFWCAGYRNVTAAYGINGFTEEMLEAFLAPRHRAGAHRLRPGRRRRDGGGEAGRAADRRGHRLLPGPVSPRDGRQRVRLEGDAGGEVARGGDPQGGVDGPGRGAGGRAGRGARRRRAPAEASAPAAATTAKEEDPRLLL